jgi:long-chain acyl-CoA synthetase
MKTIGSSILEMSARNASRVAIKFKRDDVWKEVTWPEYYTDVELVGAGLMRLGVQAGDRVAIMANTRHEWAVCDLAIIGIQAVSVPIYQNNLPQDIEFILNDSESTVFIFENRKLLKTWISIKEKCPSVKTVISMEPIESPDIIGFDKLRELGREQLKKSPLCFRRKCEDISLDHIATIIYTSGTTGNPKGVVLTHLQVMSEVTEVIPACGVTADETSLCFLPFAHVLGRVELWSHVHIASTLAYAESIERIRNNLLEVRPTFIVAVPRIFEKIHAGIMAQVGNDNFKSHVFTWATGVGRRVSELKQAQRSIPIGLSTQYFLAKKLVLKKITDAFGGNIKFALSGGAPLGRELATFFHAAGILILEGYGLSETTAAICVNTPDHYEFGTVGRPAGDVQIKIAADGEILVKSAKVMMGYHKNVAADSESLKDGWLYTGDIGEFTARGSIRITDRKKDLIKTAGGKYVAPQKIQGLLQTSPLIGNTVIHGDERKYIVALLTLDRNYAENWAKKNSVSYDQWHDLIKDKNINEQVKSSIDEINKQLSSWETIKKYFILPIEFSVEGGELTPSLKVKRKALEKRYQKEIESLY